MGVRHPGKISKVRELMGVALQYREINALRAVIIAVERASAERKHLYKFEKEFSSQPHGISVIVPVHNGAQELEELFISLRNQSIDKSLYEAIFSLNGCTDESLNLIEEFSAKSGVNTKIINSTFANVAKARNSAIQLASFRYCTFIDHDDFISRNYLEEFLVLGDYRSVVVSNIVKMIDNLPQEDYAQRVVQAGFEDALVHSADDISICYRAYTLNAIKSAPTYMLKRVQYEENLPHSEDLQYWRRVFNEFTPITVKTPTRTDIYYRRVLDSSLSRKHDNFYQKAKPRLVILDSIDREEKQYCCDSPQRKFDAQIKALLLDTLYNIGRQ
ncbi:glycosyltransferase family A protein [Brucella pseudogrignonensis]|uniref:glycosyltransferase family A protein n=1 Tax=Brucella pseudogrignonensis TaxID=419475 RepID=UPI003BA0E7C3